MQDLEYKSSNFHFLKNQYFVIYINKNIAIFVDIYYTPSSVPRTLYT